jgi:hypothetical protein
MKPAQAALSALVAAALLATPAIGHADHGAVRTHIATAHDADTENGTTAWLVVDNRSTPNPTLVVEPGQRLLLHFVNAGQHEHTLAFADPVDRNLGPIEPGNETSRQIHIPHDATGTIRYQDPVWAQQGLRGTLHVNATTTPNATPAPGSIVVLVATLATTSGRARRWAPNPSR